MDEMDKLADLKGALHPADGPSDGMRARALAFMADGGTPPRAARHRWAAPALVVAAVAVAAVATSAVLLGSPGDRHDADGSVTFTATDVVDTAAATQALNDAGVAGRVINDITPGCPTKADDIAPGDLYPDNTISRGLGSSDTVTLRTSDYPANGGLLVVVTSRGENTGRAGVPPDPVSVAIVAFDDASKIPTCVDFADA